LHISWHYNPPKLGIILPRFTQQKYNFSLILIELALKLSSQKQVFFCQKILVIQILVVFLCHPALAKPLNNAQISGLFYFVSL
jgi:hypothetical protein